MLILHERSGPRCVSDFVITKSLLWRNKCSRRSCQGSNPRPHKSGALQQGYIGIQTYQRLKCIACINCTDRRVLIYLLGLAGSKRNTGSSPNIEGAVPKLFINHFMGFTLVLRFTQYASIEREPVFNTNSLELSQRLRWAHQWATNEMGTTAET